MRHSDYRGMEKNAQAFDDEYEGFSARSVDDHYNYPFSPNSSGEFMTESTERQQHSLSSFVATKPKNKKDKKNKDTSTVSKVIEEPAEFNERTPQPQLRGRLASREYSDTQFDMEPDDNASRFPNQGEFSFPTRTGIRWFSGLFSDDQQADSTGHAASPHRDIEDQRTSRSQRLPAEAIEVHPGVPVRHSAARRFAGGYLASRGEPYVVGHVQSQASQRTDRSH